MPQSDDSLKSEIATWLEWEKQRPGVESFEQIIVSFQDMVDLDYDSTSVAKRRHCAKYFALPITVSLLRLRDTLAHAALASSVEVKD